MTASVEQIEEKFDHFNRLMFGGELPRVPIVLTRAKTFLGKCVWRVRRRPGGVEEKYGFQLRISTYRDLPESLLEDTLIHEMIHLYIHYKQLRDTSPHGRLFRQMMNHINERYGRHLTVSFKGDGGEDAQTVGRSGAPRRWHAVALVEMADGRSGVKVLPRIVERLLRYYNAVMRSPEVRSVELFLSDDAYFDRYPNSSALKVHIVDRAELAAHLRGARRLSCDGRKVVQNG